MKDTQSSDTKNTGSGLPVQLIILISVIAIIVLVMILKGIGLF